MNMPVNACSLHRFPSSRCLTHRPDQAKNLSRRMCFSIYKHDSFPLHYVLGCIASTQSQVGFNCKSAAADFRHVGQKRSARLPEPVSRRSASRALVQNSDGVNAISTVSLFC